MTEKLFFLDRKPIFLDRKPIFLDRKLFFLDRKPIFLDRKPEFDSQTPENSFAWGNQSKGPSFCPLMIKIPADIGKVLYSPIFRAKQIEYERYEQQER